MDKKKKRTKKVYAKDSDEIKEPQLKVKCRNDSEKGLIVPVVPVVPVEPLVSNCKYMKEASTLSNFTPTTHLPECFWATQMTAHFLSLEMPLK